MISWLDESRAFNVNDSNLSLDVLSNYHASDLNFAAPDGQRTEIKKELKRCKITVIPYLLTHFNVSAIAIPPFCRIPQPNSPCPTISISQFS